MGSRAAGTCSERFFRGPRGRFAVLHTHTHTRAPRGVGTAEGGPGRERNETERNGMEDEKERRRNREGGGLIAPLFQFRVERWSSLLYPRNFDRARRHETEFCHRNRGDIAIHVWKTDSDDFTVRKTSDQKIERSSDRRTFLFRYSEIERDSLLFHQPWTSHQLHRLHTATSSPFIAP